ncbi:pyridoxal phosphate-dependent transferase [Zychaea mexicana]|uniref:pyridoxal phosphate-dependent transferase n=1 Tax=Zychaea mexicana TaxID=64656 RepID=UPI0022FF2B2A|nr:pyridoxal phosphate-dependent transferase [Zychaea mexicana]KAI9494038.1 pyridoxal phosphate-dependent transferase [Zychaea mexicana]
MTNSKLFGHACRSLFLLEDGYVPLNHGSFGVCPRSIRPRWIQYQDQIERHPDRLLRREIFQHLKKNRARIASLINANVDELAFVANASYGINSVVRSSFMNNHGDKVIFFTTAYNAVERTMQFLEDAHKLELVPVKLNYPLLDQEILDIAKETIERELAQDPNVPIRLAVFDAISSVPGVRFPFEAMIKLVREYDILSLVDGAHAIGQIPLDLHAADPDFFVSNCHKWLFCPRGAAFLYVPKRNQALVHPSVINYAYKDESDSGVSTTFELEFEWPGTVDFSTYLCVGDALDFRNSLGGEEAIQSYCNDLARQGGQLLAEALGTEVLENVDNSLTVAMTNVRIPFENKRNRPNSQVVRLIIDKCIYEQNTACQPFFHNGQWYIRLSAQIYNELDDFRHFAQAIQQILKELDEE